MNASVSSVAILRDRDIKADDECARNLFCLDALNLLMCMSAVGTIDGRSCASMATNTLRCSVKDRTVVIYR